MGTDCRYDAPRNDLMSPPVAYSIGQEDQVTVPLRLIDPEHSGMINAPRQLRLLLQHGPGLVDVAAFRSQEFQRDRALFPFIQRRPDCCVAAIANALVQQVTACNALSLLERPGL